MPTTEDEGFNKGDATGLGRGIGTGLTTGLGTGLTGLRTGLGTGLDEMEQPVDGWIAPLTGVDQDPALSCSATQKMHHNCRGKKTSNHS